MRSVGVSALTVIKRLEKRIMGLVDEARKANDMADNARTLTDLQSMQAAPLSVKVRMTKSRIRDWVNEFGEDGVYVSFSGGKDSTVLLHLVREMYPDIPAVFCDTGLEYPEVREFVKTFDNVTWLKPKLTFKQVIEKYGYPFISKEVAECVWGARRYLTSLMESESLDRQTDRPTCRIATDLKDYADSVSMKNQTGGGREQVPQAQRDRFVFQWEKLTGTGRYGKQSNEQKCHKLGGGGPVRDFANLTGIRTVDGCIDARLWNSYRQFSDTTSNGNSPDARESDSGDYP